MFRLGPVKVISSVHKLVIPGFIGTNTFFIEVDVIGYNLLLLLSKDFMDENC